MPIGCNNPLCRRRNIHPERRSRNTYFDMLYDKPCHPSCHLEHCGLLIRLAYCGDAYSAALEKCFGQPE